jgi:hexosaminidase
MMTRAVKFLLLAVVLFRTTASFAAASNDLALIPQPQIVQRFESSFTLTPQTRICADRPSQQTAILLVQRLRQSTGYPLKIRRLLGSPPPNAIVLTIENANTNLGAEGYELTVSTNSIIIRAPTQAGLFYGSQTLLQLLPPEIFSSNVVRETWQVPVVYILDWPRFQWRGLMLDVSRHFYNRAEVESILDEMALYKLNRFHWHLDDDQGWRIQIKKYPRLAEIGAWRSQSAVKPPDGHVHAHPAWSQPTADKFASDGRYGGFYTERDIREVVAYATARHIMVIPEIEMPGHSEAALTAYPQFGSLPGTNGIQLNWGVYNPANPQTFVFLDNILAEVCQLFPGPYVHIGGDEVNTNYWHNNLECRTLMQYEGLKDEHELQSWFIKRIETCVNAHGKILIGWSEILNGGLATNAVVMDWTGRGLKSAEAGHDVVMTPEANCYFDHYQSTAQANEPQARNPPLPLQKVYSLDPIPTNLPAQFQPHILGVQGNLWTEYVPSLAHAQYMIFPRLCALAEVDWSALDARDWDDFQRRLAGDEKRLDELGVNYRPTEVKK